MIKLSLLEKEDINKIVEWNLYKTADFFVTVGWT